MDNNILSLISNFAEITLFNVDEQGRIKKVILNTKENFKTTGVKYVFEFFSKEDAARLMDMLSVGIDQEREYFLFKRQFNIPDYADVSVRTINGEIYVGFQFYKTSRERELTLERRINELNTAANTDPMTKLLNRYGYWERVKAILNCGDSERRVGILVVDIDKLKTINDTMGHKTGDKAITQIGDLISSTIRNRDIAVRYGGDEFVIVVEELSGSKSTAHGLGSRLVRTINQNKKNFLTTTSIGVHVTRVGDFEKYLNNENKLRKEWDKAVEIADKMAYKAKENGRNQVQFSKEA
ncbi:hypothetical protein CVU76_01485 [Candidatus Dojkabacteria bacterium HGW-Dojkabacteria-1]|uniref:GGDEF domain-containing protein n=1 Tax=Candidatus Dojkabacteria bacterium HGW-Dojkabacteria-1 TaxID=2013761 RepID=A0A2N2F3C1_9BACT|nr:MAG: hypothetical protein CVU76_01485 [Candidatus Dojkabacteria bacterium HGW-Dojkabacteria-1]